jgi:hypothetical protein
MPERPLKYYHYLNLKSIKDYSGTANPAEMD